MSASRFSQQSFSPKYSKGNQSEEKPDLLECSKCGQQVEQILALQCDHNLCLACASRIVNHWAKQFDLSQEVPPLRCDLCNVCTLVDPSAIMILQEMNQSQQFHTQQWNKSASKQESPYNNQSNHNYHTLHQQDLNICASLQYMDNPLTSNQFHDGTLADTKQSMDTIMLHQNQNQRKYDTGSSFKQKQTQHIKEPIYQDQISCSHHLSEPAILYCYTCETQCFCMECYLSGLHKNHDVKNVQKSFQLLRSCRVEQLWQKLKGTAEHLLNDQCTFTTKKMELIEIVSQAKLKIRQNFEELMLIVQKKEKVCLFLILFEKELIQAADEMIQDKLIEFDTEISKIKNNVDNLNGFSSKITDYFPNVNDALDTPSIQHSIEAFNYISLNQKKIDQFLDTVLANRQNHQPILQVSYSLDPGSVSQQVDDIRSVRVLITSLRGIETNMPTSREKLYFDRALAERGKRLFQNIVNENDQSMDSCKYQNIQCIQTESSKRINDHYSQQSFGGQRGDTRDDLRYELRDENREDLRIDRSDYRNEPRNNQKNEQRNDHKNDNLIYAPASRNQQNQEEDDKKENFSYSFINKTFSRNSNKKIVERIERSNKKQTDELFDFEKKFNEAKKIIMDRKSQ